MASRGTGASSRGDRAEGGGAAVTRRAALGDLSNLGARVRPGDKHESSTVPSAGTGRGGLSSAARAPAAAVGLRPRAAESAPMAGAAAGGGGGEGLADHGLLPIDRDDLAKPTMVAEYINDIYKHHRACEKDTAASCSYMADQDDINDRMRAILVDWLVEVHLKFKLMPETLYLTVNIIDRFLEVRSVMRSKLQLVGVTAMLLASKYEEIYAPEVRDFVYITDRAYTREQILTMESVMLNALKFKITVPTTFVFLNRFLRIADADSTCKQLACFLAERQMQEYGMLKYSPSEVAAGAVNIALRSLRGGTGAWTSELASYSGYSEEKLATCVRDMQNYCTSSGGTLGAVSKKYSLKKFGSVSEIRLAMLR